MNSSLILYIYKNKQKYQILAQRKGFKEFIQYAQILCNFYLCVSSDEKYGILIKDILTKNTGIKFKESIIKRKTPNDFYPQKKNTIIFDHNLDIWESKENENVINTKYFYAEHSNIFKDNQNPSRTIKDFKKRYKCFYHHMSNKNWQIQKIRKFAVVHLFKLMKDKI